MSTEGAEKRQHWFEDALLRRFTEAAGCLEPRKRGQQAAALQNDSPGPMSGLGSRRDGAPGCDDDFLWTSSTRTVPS